MKRSELIPGVVYGYDEHREPWTLKPMVILTVPIDKRLWTPSKVGQAFHLSTALRPQRGHGWNNSDFGYPIAFINGGLEGVSRKQIESVLNQVTLAHFEKATTRVAELRVDADGKVLGPVKLFSQEDDAKLGIAWIRVQFGLLTNLMYAHGAYFELMNARKLADEARKQHEIVKRGRRDEARHRVSVYREQLAGLGFSAVVHDSGDPAYRVSAAFSEGDLTWLLWVLSSHISGASMCAECGRRTFKDQGGAAVIRHKASCTVEGVSKDAV